MKKNTIADNSLMIIALAVIIMSLLVGTPLGNDRHTDYNLRHLDERDDSIVNQYRTIKDSMEMIEDCEEAQLSNLGNSNFIGPVGVSKIPAFISCGLPPETGNQGTVNAHYLAFSGYSISGTSAFFIDRNKYMIKYAKEDYKSDSEQHSHYETKEIPVRYIKPDPTLYSSAYGFVLVPITKQAYSTLRIILIVVGIALALLGLYYAIIRPLQTIVNISKGRVFGYQNTRNLRVAGRLFIAFAIIPVLLQLIFYNMISKQIPPEISLAFPRVLVENRVSFIVAFIMLVLAKAFEKGHKIQKENSSII
jgi:hypothetical protein